MKHVKELLAALVIALVLPAAASAGLAPHDATNDVVCESCHTSHESLGSNGYDNMCLSCHKTGSASNARKFPFAPGDAANPFRTYTSSPPPGLAQTSHTWVGRDRLTKAGSLAPKSTALLKSNIAGFLTCVKCHNIHAPRSSATNSAPFLRMLNNKDQMCLDCHRPRNTKDHRAGTHPVLVSYTGSAIVRAKPAQFNVPPVNANPANPTSEVKFVANTVSCSTCHRVHYADSNSATFDSRTSVLLPAAQGKGGHLLRSDFRGATSAAVNICSSCHKKPNHNKNGQDVQCNDCHSGHVDTYDGSVPNVFVVRRFMNISTPAGAVRNAPAFYQSTSSKNWSSSNPAKPGVCESCHVVPTGGVYPPEHSVKDNGKLCMSCHTHDSVAGAFSADCNLCHGYPPKQDTPLGPNGYAVSGAADYSTSGKYKNEAGTPHKTHAGGGSDYSYGCGQCHKGNSHNSGSTFQDLFIDKTGIVAATAGAVPAYNGAGNGTCSSVYCHSNGAPRNASLTPVLGPPGTAIPSWNGGNATLNSCSACHSALPATNAHTRHVSGKGYNCGVCHAATVDPDDFSTIANLANHADGVKTVSFNPATLANGSTWNNAAATCTSACHTDGRGGAPVTVPKWVDATTGACGACHRATGGTPINTYAHTPHLSGAYGPAMGTAVTDCQECHIYTTETAATHPNGTINLSGTACTTCHPNGLGGKTWTSGGRLDCTTCHAATPSVISATSAPYKSLFSSKGHGQGFTNYSSSRSCESCHDRNSAHISGALGDSMRLTLANDNNQCASCHNNATKVPTLAKRNIATHPLAAEYHTGTATASCKACHDVHGTNNRAMIKGIINGFAVTFTNTSTGFINTTTNRGLCQVCHTQTNHFRAGVAEASHPTKNCLQCHVHKDSIAFKPNGSCDACHGYPPVANMTGFGVQGSYTGAKLQDYANGGGPHTKPGHIKPTARPIEGWENCKACHSGGSLTPATHTMTTIPAPQNKITIQIDPALVFTSTHNATYSGPLNNSNTTGSCSNVACHFKPTPVWAP